MSDFDELLNEVLREDNRIEPLDGIEGRVLARIEAGRQSAVTERVRKLRLGWLCLPAAACLGLMVAFWYGSVTSHVDKVDKVAVRISPPAVTAPGFDLPKINEAKSRVPSSPARHASRENKKAQAMPEEEPKLDTFPAVSQKGDIAGWLGSGDDGTLAAIARTASPQTAEAYQELQSAQNKPITIAAIEIQPLH